jgi:hypothetical protein
LTCDFWAENGKRKIDEGITPIECVAFPFDFRRILYVGIFAAAKMTHLSRDKTATKMGHPIVVAWSDVGHRAKRKKQQQIPFGDDNKKSRGSGVAAG